MNDEDELKLIQEIKNLIATIRNVSRKEDLQMESWVKANPSSECGYVACIIGHHVIAELNGDIPQDREGLWEKGTLSKKASRYAHHLDDVCLDALGDCVLAKAIYDGDAEDRFEYAYNSNIFMPHELEDFRHLTSDNPTPEDAIEFMEACLEKIELP